MLHVHTSFFTVATLCMNQKDIVLSEYKGGLKKAILKNSTLLVQLNDAFSKMHPWLAQQVCTRSAHAVSKVSADAVLRKELNEKIFILILLAQTYGQRSEVQRARLGLCPLGSRDLWLLG